jgi:hypothetical protein
MVADLSQTAKLCSRQFSVYCLMRAATNTLCNRLKSACPEMDLNSA